MRTRMMWQWWRRLDGAHCQMVSEGESQDSEDVSGDEDDKNVDDGDEDGDNGNNIDDA